MPSWSVAELVALGPTFLPVALFVATFASEDLACITAGLLVARGDVSFEVAVLACGGGIFVGDLLLYVLGRLAARGLCRWSWVKERLPLAADTTGIWQERFQQHGTKYLFASRFLPGSRLPLYLAAGAIGWPIRRFAVVLFVAAAIWTPLLVSASSIPGLAIEDALADYGRRAWIAVPVVLVVGLVVARVLPLVFTWRGRRLLAAKLRRLVAWEYWPTWLVYLPVLLMLLVLAVRRRTLAAFTACNRGIPHGGLALESKGDILDQMPSGRELPVAVAPYVRLRRERSLDDRCAEVARMLASGPVVLKPDQGERGAGVAVVRDLDHARRWLLACPYDAIAQEYVGGLEFGIVWRRLANGRGEIRSIARKVPPRLVGDGVRTVEQLVLTDTRALPMARFHLANQAARLDDVPAPGATVVLGELGTHCRGATFVDARHLRTTALELALDHFMAAARGLDFGRFDLRAPSDEALQAGVSLRILELNGVTGEPAHVYHPGYPYWRGIKDLCAHWRAACATGASNMAAGHRPSSARALLRLLREVHGRRAFEAPRAEPPEAGTGLAAPS
ncbi:MAG: VTT domain-containing protein [Planctomycetota bacterium]